MPTNIAIIVSLLRIIVMYNVISNKAAVTIDIIITKKTIATTNLIRPHHGPTTITTIAIINKSITQPVIAIIAIIPIAAQPALKLSPTP